MPLSCLYILLRGTIQNRLPILYTLSFCKLIKWNHNSIDKRVKHLGNCLWEHEICECESWLFSSTQTLLCFSVALLIFVIKAQCQTNSSHAPSEQSLSTAIGCRHQQSVSCYSAPPFVALHLDFLLLKQCHPASSVASFTLSGRPTYSGSRYRLSLNLSTE